MKQSSSGNVQKDSVVHEKTSKERFPRSLKKAQKGFHSIIKKYFFLGETWIYPSKPQLLNPLPPTPPTLPHATIAWLLERVWEYD